MTRFREFGNGATWVDAGEPMDIVQRLREWSAHYNRSGVSEHFKEAADEIEAMRKERLEYHNKNERLRAALQEAEVYFGDAWPDKIRAMTTRHAPHVTWETLDRLDKKMDGIEAATIERCAQVVDKTITGDNIMGDGRAKNIAAAIRALKNKP